MFRKDKSSTRGIAKVKWYYTNIFSLGSQWSPRQRTSIERKLVINEVIKIFKSFKIIFIHLNGNSHGNKKKNPLIWLDSVSYLKCTDIENAENSLFFVSKRTLFLVMLHRISILTSILHIIMAQFQCQKLKILSTLHKTSQYKEDLN